MWPSWALDPQARLLQGCWVCKAFALGCAIELTGVYDKPRAIALDHEIMRVFQALHIAEALQPHMEPFTNSEFFGVDGQLIKCMSTIAPPYPLGYAPSIVFSQPPMEALLRERVAALPSVTVQLGQSVVDLSQGEQRRHVDFAR